MPNDRRDRGEEWGEDASDELMARAEAVPGSFTAEVRGDEIVYTEADAKGRVRRAVEAIPADEDGPLAPLAWEDVEGAS